MKKIIFLCLILLFIIILSACGGRDTSTLESSIIGHWVTQPDNEYNAVWKDTHFYISKDKIIQVENDGTKTEMKYKILSTNDKKNSITIKVIDPSGESMDNVLTFPSKKERNKLVELINANGVEPYAEEDDDLTTIESKINSLGPLTQNIPWKYVDDKQKP